MIDSLSLVTSIITIMQTVILAAGLGKRLQHLTSDNTKCMVEVNGKKLIDRSLDILTDFPISRIVLVIGYEGEKVKRHLGVSYRGVPIVYVNNPIYATTNNIYSLALAREYLQQEDTLLLESDLIYDASIIRRLLEDPNPDIAVVDKYDATMDGTVVKINETNDILSFVPKRHFNYSEVSSYYKTVNIYKFSREFLSQCYIPFLDAYTRVLGNNQYYEQVLRVISNLDHTNLKAMPLGGDAVNWYEIDDLQDLNNAELLFEEVPAVKFDKYQNRYGGYWRFQKLKDFCYLVNPYFPPQRMIDEFQYSFKQLLINYPSGQDVQNLLADNLFDCGKNQILVGNGAAELICACMESLNGKIGIIYPTFQEYPARISSDRIVAMYPDTSNFSYTLEDLKIFSQHIDCLLLINPDNPTGHYIAKEQLLELIAWYHAQGKMIIVDESFVDFATGGIAQSIVHRDILEKYPNLIVIKSISKSYGVPGVRLGIMATADKEFLAQCRKRLTIWNINSFGEYFLQIMPKYRDDYSAACTLIADERDRFQQQLCTIPYLRVIPSQANYIMMEVLHPFSARQLCDVLLMQHNILIKNCSTKKGCSTGEYIRVAVRNEEDNEILFHALCHLLPDLDKQDCL